MLTLEAASSCALRRRRAHAARRTLRVTRVGHTRRARRTRRRARCRCRNTDRASVPGPARRAFAGPPAGSSYAASPVSARRGCAGVHRQLATRARAAFTTDASPPRWRGAGNTSAARRTRARRCGRRSQRYRDQARFAGGASPTRSTRAPP